MPPMPKRFARRFSARLRDELLNGEIFCTLRETQIVIEAGDSLQRDQAPRLNRIHATSTRGIRAFIRRVAGCATPTCGTTQRGLTIICAEFCMGQTSARQHRTLGQTDKQMAVCLSVIL